MAGAGAVSGRAARCSGHIAVGRCVAHKRGLNGERELWVVWSAFLNMLTLANQVVVVTSAVEQRWHASHRTLHAPCEPINRITIDAAKKTTVSATRNSIHVTLNH